MFTERGKMKVKITKPGRVNLLSGEVEVTKEEAERLFLLGLAERKEDARLEEKVEKKTRKK